MVTLLLTRQGIVLKKGMAVAPIFLKMYSTVSAFFVVLLASLLTLAACSDPDGPTDSDLIGISGSWLWISSVGGFAPQVITPPPGTRFIDFYSSHGSFSRRRNDTLVMTARFSLANERATMLVKYTNVQTYQGFQSDMWDAWVDVRGDTLYVSDNGCDMYRHTYARIR